MILPAYNEIGNLERAIAEALEALGALGMAFEIVVVESGSTDGTRELADRLATENPAVRVLHEGWRRGMGSAIRLGFNAARGTLLFYTDVDLPFGFDPIARGVEALATADALVGFKPYRHETAHRFVISRVFNWMGRFLFQVGVRDVNCGLKGVRREVWSQLEVRSNRLFFDTELFSELVRHGALVVDLPVEYSPRHSGASTISPVRESLAALCEMTGYIVRRNLARGWRGRKESRS
ncbi:glycosyltransferase [Planctomycetota bacterium]